MLVLRILIALRFDNAGAENYSECGRGKQGKAHVCAWFTRLLSSGSRLTAVLSFSLSSSTRSMLGVVSQSPLLLPESDVKEGTAELLTLAPR